MGKEIEKEKQSKKGCCQKHGWWMVLLIITIVAIGVFGGCKIYCCRNKLSDLESKINVISESVSQNQDGNMNVNQDILSYMENEMTNYREFIQREREFLVFLLGTAISAIAALIGFFGWNSCKNIRSDVERVFQKKGEDIIDERMCEYLKDPNNSGRPIRERLDALKNAITRQEKHQEMKIQFFMQKQEIIGSETLKDAQRLLKNKGLNINLEKTIDFEELSRKTNEDIKEYFKKYFEQYNILIYQVYFSRELKKKDTQNEVRDIYKILSELAQDGHYCIFYIPSSKECKEYELLDLEPSVYYGISNTGISLVQQIITLLDC